MDEDEVEVRCVEGLTRSDGRETLDDIVLNVAKAEGMVLTAERSAHGRRRRLAMVGRW